MLYQLPIAEVARWPGHHLQLLDHYLARTPAPIERVEFMLAWFMAMYVNAHSKKGAPEKKPADFMPFEKAWAETMTLQEQLQTLMDLE